MQTVQLLYITVTQKTRTVIACRITVRVLSEYKGIRRSMNVSCGRRLTEATFTCVRGFPYGRLYASRMDDTAETQVDQPRQRHDRQHRQCREPAMSSTSVMIAICFAPKERASLFGAIRRLGGVAILLHDCLLRKPSVIPFPYRVLWLDQSVTCLSLLGQ